MHAIRLTEDEIKLRNIIANNLKIIRKQNKLSQKEVALKLNCTFQQVGKYEKATNTLSSIKLKKLADMFNLPVERFYFPIETVIAQTQEIKIAHWVRLSQKYLVVASANGVGKNIYPMKVDGSSTQKRKTSVIQMVVATTNT